jgi:hypothetical protein
MLTREHTSCPFFAFFGGNGQKNTENEAQSLSFWVNTHMDMVALMCTFRPCTRFQQMPSIHRVDFSENPELIYCGGMTEVCHGTNCL